MNEPRTSAVWLHAAVWLLAGVVLLAYSVSATVQLLRRSDPFRLSDGAEQSVLIFWLMALFSLVQAMAQLRREVRGSWIGKVLAVPLFLGSFVWLFFGGPAYEPWPFSVAVALVFIAALWQLFVHGQ